MDSGARVIVTEPRRKEIINGKMYLMAGAATPHNDIIKNLTFIFQRFLRGKRCKLYGENIAVKFDEENEVLPDIKIVCDRDKIKRDKIHGSPDFIVEVLSPSTSKKDLIEKKDLYERHGVREYWIINPNDKSVQVYLLKEGKYKLDYVYHDFIQEDIDYLRNYGDEEQQKVLEVKEIMTSLYSDDLIINISEIFEDMFE